MLEPPKNRQKNLINEILLQNNMPQQFFNIGKKRKKKKQNLLQNIMPQLIFQ